MSQIGPQKYQRECRYEGVHLSYQHLNPHQGNESFLLRFSGPEYEETPCILVDAGKGCSLEGVLRGDDRLAGVLLTHAHIDHYRRLPECHREGVPVYTSPATAKLLPDVLDEAAQNYGVRASDSVIECLTPLTGETSIDSGIDVRPLPAGHAPGAVGYLLQVEDADADRTVRTVVTGDFTVRRAGGYPGLDPDSLLDIDVLFLTAATDEAFPDSMTAALGDALAGLAGGGPVLVTTSGLTGVQVAYLLGTLLDRFDREGTVRVVGQVAKHYASLEYDVPNVDVLETFDDPGVCIDSGVITVAGPEVPRERSSGRIFDRLEQNAAATVVQITGGGYDPLESAGCSLSAHRVVNHPSPAVRQDLVSTTEPQQTILTHHGGVEAEDFMGDWPSYVWATNDDDEHLLYADGDWQSPPWVDGGTELRVRSNGGATMGVLGGLVGDVPAPEIGREAEPDLEVEGILLEQLEERLRLADSEAGSTRSAGAVTTDRTNDSPTPQPDTTAETMSESNDTPDSTEGGPDTTGEIYDTILTDTKTPTDEQIEALVNDDRPDNLVSVHARKTLSEEDTGVRDPDSEDVDPKETSGPDGSDDSSQSNQQRETNTEALSDPGPESDDRGEEEAVEPETESPPPKTDVDDGRTREDDLAHPESQTRVFDADPALVALAKLTVRTEDTASSLPQMTTIAVESYLTGLLRGDDISSEPSDGGDGEARIEGNPVVQALADGVLSERDSLDSVTDLVVSAAEDTFEDEGTETERTLPVSGFDAYASLVEAVVENDDYPGDSPDEVVQAAVACGLGIDDYGGRGEDGE